MTAMPCTSHEIKTTLLVMLCLPQAILALKCHKGTVSLFNGEVVSKESSEETCMGGPDQYCATFTVFININEQPSQFIIRSCDEHCLIESSNGCQSFLTDFKKVLIEEEANATYNISSCHASCCNDADLCNQIDLSKHLPAPGRRQCYEGVQEIDANKEVLINTVKPSTCLASESSDSIPSCLRVHFEMYGGTPQTSGSFVMLECQPTEVCDSITCEFVTRTLPRAVREIVTSCEISCCNDNLCNFSVCCRTNVVFLYTFVFSVMLYCSLT